MADFDEMVASEIRHMLSVKVACTVDSDGDPRIRVELLWGGVVFDYSEDYWDGTGAKDRG